VQAPRVLFGRGAASEVGREAGALGERVLFVCTPSLKASPHADRIRAVLGNLLVAEFTEVAPHVPRETVEAARALAMRERADVVVAMGGGSAIGVGKGVVLGNLGTPHPDLIGLPPADSRSTRYENAYSPKGGREIALIAIPTTYAGSELTPTVGITDLAEKRKFVQRNPVVLPKLAVYDVELTLDLSAELTASTALNALAHSVEAGYARNVNPLVPPVAEEGIRRILRSLPACIADGHDVEAREELLRGAYLGGFSIANATMALHHGLCHVLGGHTGIAHGVVNAIMLPHVMRFNAEFAPDALTPVVAAALVASLPLPQRLRDAGVAAEVLPLIVQEAAASATVTANPKPVSEADIIAILDSAW
jgi:maleylacetate reductase